MIHYFIKFIYSVVCWGIVSLINQAILIGISGDQFDIMNVLSTSVLFGVIASTIVSIIYTIRMRKLDIVLDSKTALSTDKTNIIDSKLDLSETQKRLENLFSKKFKGIDSDVIQLNVLSFMSWSKITIKSLEQTGINNRFEVNIKPVIPTNIFDFAESHLLLTRIKKVIS